MEICEILSHAPEAVVVVEEHALGALHVGALLRVQVGVVDALARETWRHTWW